MKTAIENVRFDTKALAAAFVQNATTYGAVKTAYLPMVLLYVNEDYQRPPQNKIAKIAANFDENKCGFLLVSYERDNGRFAIVDGQNRFLAAKIAGKESLPCQILENVNAKQEALIFARQDENRVKVSPVDKFKARVYAGEENALAVHNIIRSYNLVYDRNSLRTGDNGKVKSVFAAEQVYKRTGESGLRWVIEVAQEAWAPVSIHGNVRHGSKMMQALEMVYENHISDADKTKSRLAAILRPVTPELLKAKANLRYVARRDNIAMAMLMEDLLAGAVTPKALES